MKNPNEDIQKKYRITSQANRYNNHWLVVRKHNNTIAFSSPSLFETLRWVNTWGLMRLNEGGPQCNI